MVWTPVSLELKSLVSLFRSSLRNCCLMHDAFQRQGSSNRTIQSCWRSLVQYQCSPYIRFLLLPFGFSTLIISVKQRNIAHRSYTYDAIWHNWTIWHLFLGKILKQILWTLFWLIIALDLSWTTTGAALRGLFAFSDQRPKLLQLLQKGFVHRNHFSKERLILSTVSLRK